MSRLVLAIIGVAVGIVAAVCGVLVVFGAGWALIAGGVACAALSALLIDVEERDGEPSPTRT